MLAELYSVKDLLADAKRVVILSQSGTLLSRVYCFCWDKVFMKKLIYVFLFLILGSPVGLHAGLFDIVTLPVRIVADVVDDVGRAVGVGAVFGAGSSGQRQDDEAAYRQQAYERDQNQKQKALSKLDAEYAAVQNELVETENAIACLSQTVLSLQEQITCAEREMKTWQSKSPERIQHLALLREQLSACIIAYDCEKALLKSAHDERMKNLEREAAQRLAELQRNQKQEALSWQPLVKKEDAELAELCDQKRALESHTAINDEQIES